MTWPGVRSVRFRITLVATLAVAVVLVAAGAGLVVAVRHSLTSSLQESLRQEVDALDTDAVRSGRLHGPLDPAGDDDAVAQVVQVGAEVPVQASSANLAGAPPLVVPDGFGWTTDHVDSVLEDGDHFLVVSRSVEGPTDAMVVVSVGSPLDDVADATRALARSLLVGVPLVVALLALLVWWLVGRTLRPVEAIRTGVSEIGGSADLDRRVPVPPGDDEVARLATTMNEMLARVEAASEHQQRFVADASHELRSPLTRIRAELEVDLAHAASADPMATQRSVLEEVAGLEHLVDDLLLLARTDAKADPPRLEVLDLDDLVLEEAHRLPESRAVAVDTTGVGSAQVAGDPRHLGRALRNVVENAARHARSRVTVTLEATGGQAIVRVADDGPGIPEDQRDAVFERFTRLDESRTGASGGAGLGLAIAREVVLRHGGTIAVDPWAGPGACVVLTLPLASANA